MATKTVNTDVALARKIEEENEPLKMTYDDPHPLVTLLARKGIPVETFAKELGYSPAYFQMILMRWKRPGTKLALQIEDRIGMSVSYLLRIPLKSDYKVEDAHQ